MEKWRLSEVRELIQSGCDMEKACELAGWTSAEYVRARLKEELFGILLCGAGMWYVAWEIASYLD